jgi:hypothetical protein
VCEREGPALNPCFYGPQAERRADAPQANVVEYFARLRIVRQPFVIPGQCYSLVNASFPVEVWRQPRVPDSGAATMDVVVEPAV